MTNEKRLRIFLSHSSEDSRIAEEVNYALSQEGHDVFFDRDSLPAGTKFHSTIREKVSSADLFLFFISPTAVAKGRYTLTELELAKDQWPDSSGRILPVMVSETDLGKIPAYLSQVSILEPKGNIAAEVVAHIEKLIRDGFLATAGKPKLRAVRVLKETYHDKQVEFIRKQLDELLSHSDDQKISLQKNVFPILRDLFARRNTFEERIFDCEDEIWSKRFIAALETKRLLEAYRRVIIGLAEVGDEKLIRSFDQLKLHLYLQRLSKLFSPPPRVDDLKELLKSGEIEAAKKCLQKTEIRPKERIDVDVVAECDKHQSMMKNIWEQWPIF